MRNRIRYDDRLYLALLCVLGASGCGKPDKSTPELIADLKSPQDKDRLIAVRLLPGHKGDAAQIVPEMIAALKDSETDVRLSAAIGLGYFGESAKEAIPALLGSLNDRDARVREAAGVALSRIEPARFTSPSNQPRSGP